MKKLFLKGSLFLFLLVSLSDSFALGRVVKRPPAPDPSPLPEPEPEPSNPVDFAARWEAVRSGTDVWTAHTYNRIAQLGQGLLNSRPSDYRDFCPQYPQMDRVEKREFWVYLISSLSELESYHNPSTSYRESFKDRNGRYIYSRGLLQISIESGNGYGCGLKKESELHDPYTNLDCGIRILNRWLDRDKRIAGKVGSSWRGGARYWSVLRTSSKVSKIKAWTKEFCRQYQ